MKSFPDNDRSIAEYEEMFDPFPDPDTMAAYYADQERLAEESQCDRTISRESAWRMQNGKTVAVKDMTDSHLLNTIRVLQDRSPVGTKWNGDAVRRREWINVMANEAYRRGLKLL